jgi:hypothetical protein
MLLSGTRCRKRNTTEVEAQYSSEFADAQYLQRKLDKNSLFRPSEIPLSAPLLNF